VDVSDSVDISKLTVGKRVTLLSDSYKLEKMLPSSVDPLVSLMMVEKVPDSTYDMIGGLDQQIKEIKEVIELGLKHPELFESLGIAQPKGVLLYGPPGTGKTLLARAVAHHTDCKFIRVSGSELVQKYIGEGSRMVRELFVMAREHAPSIIFMDEIDSIGSSRVEGSSGGDSEVQRTMLELLNQLDGFEPTKNIKIIMATNRLDILDPALLRPGRIDRKIEFPPPSVEARADILRIHSRKMNLTRGINLTKIAEKMNGCSGAELKGVCTEAGMYALRERRVHVTQEDFDLATAKILNKHDDKEMSLSKVCVYLRFCCSFLTCCSCGSSRYEFGNGSQWRAVQISISVAFARAFEAFLGSYYVYRAHHKANEKSILLTFENISTNFHLTATFMGDMTFQ